MSPEFSAFTESYKRQLRTGLILLDKDAIEAAATLIRDTSDGGGTIFLCGNGGSAALASHMATDLQLGGIRAIPLTDVAAVTTYANDFGYSHSFFQQASVLGKRGDLLIAISGSGESENVLYACKEVKKLGLQVITISGIDGGHMGYPGYTDLHIHCPGGSMGPSQDLHLIALHLITYWIMEQRKESKE